jgi:RAD3-like DEAD/DEAH box helicase
MPNTLYYSKAVMGGGKSYAAISYLCNDLANNVIYVVPTIELAKQIAADIESTENRIYEFEFDDDGPLDESGNRLLTDRKVKAITSDEYSVVKREFLEYLKTYRKYDVLVVTHECLFSLTEKEFSLLKEWVVFIDEDPHPFRIHTVTDQGRQIAAFNHLIKELPSNTNGITKFELDSNQREVVNTLAREKHSRAYNNSVRDFFSLISSKRTKTTYFKDSKDKSVWFGVSHLPLDKIINSAIETYVFSSGLSFLTNLYLKNHNINRGKPRFTVKHQVFPLSLQKKIKIYRIWQKENHSLSILNKFDRDKLKGALLATIGDRKFISRTNNYFSAFFDGVSNHSERVSKITNGLNKFKNISAIIDLAVYNASADYDEFFSLLDEKYKQSKGSMKKGRDEKESLETSAQAVGRLGLRMMDNAKHDEYIVVIPDLRTEEYLKKNYFPDAVYMGAIMTDKIHARAGRKKGGINKDIPEKIKEVKRLVSEETIILKKAMKIVKISSATYYKYKDQFS